jgi:hypothetical protein
MLNLTLLLTWNVPAQSGCQVRSTGASDVVMHLRFHGKGFWGVLRPKVEGTQRAVCPESPRKLGPALRRDAVCPELCQGCVGVQRLGKIMRSVNAYIFAVAVEGRKKVELLSVLVQHPSTCHAFVASAIWGCRPGEVGATTTIFGARGCS